MESLFKLPLVNGAKVRVLQITDTHLFAGEDETLLGVNTFNSYRAVLDAIKAQQREVDIIAATGDLAQDQSVAAYHQFCRGISELPAPCVWLPGNHDFQPAMFETPARRRDQPVEARSARRSLANHSARYAGLWRAAR